MIQGFQPQPNRLGETLDAVVYMPPSHNESPDQCWFHIVAVIRFINVSVKLLVGVIVVVFKCSKTLTVSAKECLRGIGPYPLGRCK